jgi:mediator of RNA polymerase II transcription subunit 16, fungi type
MVGDWSPRKLAWSSAGSIAQISDDGSKITFRVMIRDQKSGDWNLSSPTKAVIHAPEGTEFVHLQFNGQGVDLAAADNLGGVHIYVMMGVLGRMQLSPADGSVNEGQRSELDAVVGLHWLPMFPLEFKVGSFAE